MNSNNADAISLNEKSLDTMKIRIIEHVKHNINTKSKTDKEMINEIRAIIIEEANKNYWGALWY